MTWERRRLARQKALYDSTNNENPLVYQLVEAGAKVTPTSAMITIYTPAGVVTGIAAASMGSPSGSLFKYELDTSTEASWPVGKGYRADVIVIANSETYPKRHFFFDIAKYIFRHTVTLDSLVAYYPIRGMSWDGDEDFSNLIDRLADNFQNKIEAKIIDAERLRMEWLVDPGIVDTAFASYVVSHILHAAGNHEEGTRIGDDYKASFEAVMSTYPIDKGEDGTETTKEGGIQEVRLVT